MELTCDKDEACSFAESLKRLTTHEPMPASAGDEGHVDEYRKMLMQQHEQWMSATKRLQQLREKQALTK